MRECYTAEQVRINKTVDLLAEKIAAHLRKDASTDSASDNVVAEILRKAALELTQSQKTWKTYRDHHCNAVMYTWTTGSGAGAAHQACMLQLGQARLRELRSAFQGRR